jgi:hypothetical protein
MENYGLVPGQSAPSLNRVINARQARIAESEQQLQQPGQPEERMEQLRQQIAQARLDILQTKAAQFFQTTTMPAIAARSFQGRELNDLAQRIGFGAGIEERTQLYGQSLATANRRLEREQTNLQGIEERFNRREATFDEVDAARNAAQDAQLRRDVIQRELALQPSGEVLRRANLDLARTNAAFSLAGTLGKSSADLIASGQSVYGSMVDQSRGFLEQAKDILKNNPKDTDAAQEALAQASVLGMNAQAFQVGLYSTYQPSASDRLRMSRLETAINLQASNPLTGGQVNRGLRTDLITQINKQIGGIDAQIAQAPEDQREAVAANLEPLRSGLLESRQQQAIAAFYGDRSHYENVAINMPGDIRIRAAMSLGAYQAFGGMNPVLGGRERLEAPRRVTARVIESTPIPQSARRGYIPRPSETVPSHLPATLGPANESHPIPSAFASRGGVMTESMAMGAPGQGDNELKDLLRESNRLLGQIAARVGSGGEGAASGLPATQQLSNDPANGLRRR